MKIHQDRAEVRVPVKDRAEGVYLLIDSGIYQKIHRKDTVKIHEKIHLKIHSKIHN